MRILNIVILLAFLAGLSTQAQTVSVSPTGETQVVVRGGPADLDVALWPNAATPASSLLIVTDSVVGLTTFRLDGTEAEVRQSEGVAFGVDVRDGFALPGATVPLVVVANGTFQSLAAYVVDPLTLRLRRVDTGALSVPSFAPRNVALYRSAASGRLHAFMADVSGSMRQLELSSLADGGVEGVPVRSFEVGGPVAGAVADDGQGALFVAQQDTGIWRYGAEPDAGTGRVLVATANTGLLTAPLGGLSLYTLPDGDGYLAAASVGGDQIVLFRRQPPHATVGSFSVAAAGTIDAVTDPRSIEVSSLSLGPDYPSGLVAVQDTQNDPTQNHKLISWQAVANAFSPPLRVNGQQPPSDGGTPDGGADGGTGPNRPPGGGTVPPDEGGCDCTAASMPGTILLVLLGLGLLGRRRRG